MIFSEDLVQINEANRDLIAEIAKSDIYLEYLDKYQKLLCNEPAQNLITDFKLTRSKYLKITDYGSQAPEFLAYQKAALIKKRKMDLNPVIAAYKVAELNLSTMIDAITLAITNCVSPDIIVETGNPFFMTNKKNHHGGHHHV